MVSDRENSPQEPSSREAASLAASSLQARALEARKAERRVLARELHDTVVQPLTALLISMENLSQPGGMVSESQVVAWKALAREAVQSLRGTMAGLRTHPHAQHGLPEALRTHLVPYVASRGLPLTLQATAWPTDLPEDWTAAFYLTVREAVMNVEKHAQATTCVVLLRADDRQLAITIIDDGIGFRPEQHRRVRPGRPADDGAGFGLGGMRDRVRQLGGRMSINSVPGRGTRIEIRVPRAERERKSGFAHENATYSRRRGFVA
jgi:signal transduction histidine kinase